MPQFKLNTRICQNEMALFNSERVLIFPLKWVDVNGLCALYSWGGENWYRGYVRLYLCFSQLLNIVCLSCFYLMHSSAGKKNDYTLHFLLVSMFIMTA